MKHKAQADGWIPASALCDFPKMKELAVTPEQLVAVAARLLVVECDLSALLLRRTVAACLDLRSVADRLHDREG